MIPAPLYKDPIYDGAADPMIIRNASNGYYYMFYTQRRANQNVENVSFAYGTAIGVAESPDGEYWHYVGALDLAFEFGHNTYWAPEIVYDEKTKLYHMYVSYIRGIYNEWKGVATIEHYTSEDLFYWKHIGPLSFGSSRIIDPCIIKLPSGIWRMWYKDENRNAKTGYADSEDLYNWTFRGIAIEDEHQEGANVFEFAGKYWLIADPYNKGLVVYHSDDCEHFYRQDKFILSETDGIRRDDDDVGHHADVFNVGERAFIVYHTHPTPDFPERSSVQLAELSVENGILKCDRNKEFSF